MPFWGIDLKGLKDCHWLSISRCEDFPGEYGPARIILYADTKEQALKRFTDLVDASRIEVDEYDQTLEEFIE